MGEGKWNGFSIVLIRSWSNHKKGDPRFKGKTCKAGAETPKSLSLLSQYECVPPSSLRTLFYPPTRDYRSDNETRLYLTSCPVQSLNSSFHFDLQETRVARAAVISGGLSTSSSVGIPSSLLVSAIVSARHGEPSTIRVCVGRFAVRRCGILIPGLVGR